MGAIRINPEYESVQEFSSANATPVSGMITAGAVRAYRCGHAVTVALDGVAHPQMTARTTIATLPVGYRPAFQAYGMLNSRNGQYFVVNSDGTVQLNAMAAGTEYAMATYVVR